jgi:hypothetical protein
MAVSTRAHAFLFEIPQAELEFATSIVIGEKLVEIPDRYSPLDAPSRTEHIVPPNLPTLRDYATTSCMHECAILKQPRYARHAHEVRRNGTVMKRTLMPFKKG